MRIHGEDKAIQRVHQNTSSRLYTNARQRDKEFLRIFRFHIFEMRQGDTPKSVFEFRSDFRDGTSLFVL